MTGRQARAAALALLGLLAGTAARAQGGWQVELGAGGDHLSNGAPDWRQIDFSLRKALGPRSPAEFTLRQTERSGQTDQEIGALLGMALDAQWSASLAATVSPSHNVLPRSGGRLEVVRSFSGGWVGSLAAGRRMYESGASAAHGNSGMQAGVERYVDAWRFAAALGYNRIDGGGSTPSGRLQVDRYFDAERGRIGFIVGQGRELESLPATGATPADVLDQRVATVALVGTLPLASAWALTGELSHASYSDLRRLSGAPAGAAYDRTGLRLGVRRDF